MDLSTILLLVFAWLIISIIFGKNYFLNKLLEVAPDSLPLVKQEREDTHALQKKNENEELLRKLTTIGYFEHFSTTEKEAFINCLQAIRCTEADIAVQLRLFLFPYDKHSFVLEYFLQLILDPVGVMTKMEGIHARRDHTGFSSFYNYLGRLGLQVSIEPELGNSDAINLIIEGIAYRVGGDYLDEPDFCNQFIELLNQHLDKIGASERLYLWDTYPGILIFLSQEQYDYLHPLKR